MRASRPRLDTRARSRAGGAVALLLGLSLIAAALAGRWALGPTVTAAAPDASGGRPNVVVIETDDQTLESMKVMRNVNSLIGAQGATFANSFVNTLIIVFGVVAVIALLVGGIGVMNIMLVSVKERTREIGLRKALGATSGAITWQFLVEAITLTLVGGIIGLAIGYGMGGVATLVMSAMWKISWVPAIPLSWVISVMICSVGIGLVFGVYPAWRAGKLDPIIALRYE